ncbi:MAG TPA: lamin tail domain-containing protein, partial [Sedimentisphaerales bacterium]|nr:lamin tail domain-containing protein [Sedimentisphaerales bacterium]
RNASCCLRIPFEVAPSDLAALSSLTLKVRYDDGFVVYLNGSEIARMNFTGNPVWNSAANTQNPDEAAVSWEPFDVTSHLDKLRSGQNLLAVHAMNVSTTSSDFLISVELVSAKAPAGGLPTGVSPTALRYTGPIALSSTAVVKSRVLSNGVWSALNEAVFAVGPVAESLRISEIHYHPEGDPNTEFIELTHIGSEAINLNLVRFVKGIAFTFPSFELSPGGYCLLVRDLAAFEAVYGDKLPVVGQYAGSLDNAGERLELLDAVGQVIQSFEYKDNWFDLTDGLGFSLTMRDPKTGDPSKKNAWQAAIPSPGRAHP